MATLPYDFDTGLMDFTSGSTAQPDYTFGNYADFGSMTDGSGSNLFSEQLDAFQPTMIQRLLAGLNSMGQAGANNMGALNLGLGATQGLASLYNSNKQMGLLEQQLNQQRDQWNANYNNQRANYNERLADRQRQRVAANPNAESEDSYLKRWGI